MPRPKGSKNKIKKAPGTDGRGGKRAGAGRKPRVAEGKLIEKLDNIINEDEAVEALRILAIDKKDFRALQLYLQYRWGKPKESMDVDLTSNGEGFTMPILSFFSTDEDEDSDEE